MSMPPIARFGREYLAIPGPSVIPDAVLQAMHRGGQTSMPVRLWIWQPPWGQI